MIILYFFFLFKSISPIELINEHIQHLAYLPFFGKKISIIQYSVIIYSL